LACRLTKAACSCITSPGEGKPDCQSLFGRLDWSEEIANPSPLDSQGDSRAKWVGKTRLLRSRHTTASVEWSSAVHSKTSEIGVSDAPTDRSDLRRLNRLSELSPATTLAGMRRLIDSDRSLASPLLVSHPRSYTRGRSVGAFSSVLRAGRLRIANGHAGTHRRDIVSRPVWTAQQGLPLGSKQGTLMGSWYQPGIHGTPRQGDVAAPGLPAVGNDRQDPGPSRACPIHKVLRFWQAGHCGPARLDRTNRALPHGSALAANRDPWVPGSKQGPPWVPGQGRRDDPQAVFGRLACGERLANPTP
jgi:hypothetical protein